MYQIETKQGKVLGQFFDLKTARQVKARIYKERGYWVDVVKMQNHVS